MDSFYDESELQELGLAQPGKQLKISRNARFYQPEKISIGDNVRVDDFCILSGKIVIGSHVHISAGCYIFGGDEGVEIDDYVCVSSRGVIYAVSDDYSGNGMAGPLVPAELRDVIQARVHLNKHALIGTSSVILPGVSVGEGCAVGALSLVNKSLPAWTICVGSPARVIGERSRKIIELEALHKAKLAGS